MHIICRPRAIRYGVRQFHRKCHHNKNRALTDRAGTMVGYSAAVIASSAICAAAALARAPYSMITLCIANNLRRVPLAGLGATNHHVKNCQ